MHDVPAAWYDDPEDPTQYRYWNGTEWTEHRAPKRIPAAPRSRQGVIGETWNLGVSSIGPLLGIAALYFVVLIPLAVLVIVGAAQSLEPDVFDIVDRVTASDFDPDVDPADDAFLDSIRFEPTTLFWSSLVIAILALIPVNIIAYGMSMALLANRYRGGSMTFSGAWATAIRRFRRTLGISLLWGLCWSASVVVLALAWIAAFYAPLLFIVVIPGTVGLVVYGYPFAWLALAPLFIGPTDRPPFRSLVAQVRSRWTKAALPVLLINLVLIAVNIGSSILGLIPILGVVVALAGSIAQWIGQYASAVVIWDEIGGDVDPEIVSPT